MEGSDPLGYWEERLAKGPALDTAGWIGLGLAFNRWMYRIRARVFNAAVRRLLREHRLSPQNLRVLDAGAGSGFYVDLWKDFGVRNISACDFTNAAVQSLSRRYPGMDVRRADVGAQTCAFDPHSFDAISCMDVLFHIVDDTAYERAIGNLSAMLRPGGLLIFSENFLHVGTVRSAHQTSRSLTDISAMVQRAGLRIIRRRPVFVLMNTPVDSTNALLRAWWKMVYAIASHLPRAAGVLGMLLYPVEVLLTSALREGPSTEMMICRRAP
jgi:SAM-dependent methyltransferase